MSRVYDALRQWSREHGVSSDMLSFEVSPPESNSPEQVDKAESLRWADIAEFVPAPRSEDHLIALNDGTELGTDKFRLLQSRLRQVSLLRKIRLVLITSAVPEDGKSLVAANLAISLAMHTNLKVLLLEGDLHRPTVATRLGMTGRSGLADCLRSGGRLEEHCYHMRNSNLWVFPAGRPQEHSLGLLQSPNFQRVLTSLSSAFDWILVDSPPLLPLADAGFWAQLSDAILFVVRDAHTHRGLLQRGLEVIDTTKVLGIVFNDCEPTEHNYYNRYYRSYHAAQTV